MKIRVFHLGQFHIDTGTGPGSPRVPGLFFSLALVFFMACASAPRADDASTGGFAGEGRISYEGSNPFDRRLKLECRDGSAWIISGPRFESDLSVLDGHMVRIVGRVFQKDASLPAVEITGYRLLPVDGMAVMQGAISVEDTSVYIDRYENGKRYRIEGPLRKALSNFDRFRVWVWDESSAGRGGGPGHVRVSGYEILGPAD